MLQDTNLPEMDTGERMDHVQQCISSISDNHAFVIGDRDPIDAIIAFQTDSTKGKYFQPSMLGLIAPS